MPLISLVRNPTDSRKKWTADRRRMHPKELSSAVSVLQTDSFVMLFLYSVSVYFYFLRQLHVQAIQ